MDTRPVTPDRTALVRIARGELVPRDPHTATLVKRVKAKVIVYDHLQQRDNGVWYYRKGKDIKTTTFRDYESAKQWAQHYEAAKEDRRREGLGIAPKTLKAVPTVQQAIERYWAKYSSQKAHPRSDQRARHFMEMYADRYITEIGPIEAQNWIVARTGSLIEPGLRNAGKPRSDDSVSVECMVLKAMFNVFIEEKVYPHRNPWIGKNGPGRIPRESVLSHLRDKKGHSSDQERLFRELADPKRTDGWRKVGGGVEALRAVQVLLGSGLRLSEFRRLRPCDVVQDGPGGSGWVLDVVRGKGGKVRGSRKDRKARYIPLQPSTVAVLEAQRLAKGLEPDARTPYWPYSACWLGKYLQRACAAANVVVLIESEDADEAPDIRGGITPHDLRRTYGTRLAKSGKVPPKVLQQLMGHASYEITMRHYQGFTHDDRIDAARSVDLGV